MSEEKTITISISELDDFLKAHEKHPLRESAYSLGLDDFLRAQKNESFSELLFRFIREKEMSEPDAYRRAGLTPQHFSKIRSDSSYRPTKSTVLALATSLGLDLDETKDLLRAAGLAFTHASMTDMVVEYFIINGPHDLFTINEALFRRGLEPLYVNIA